MKRTFKTKIERLTDEIRVIEAEILQLLDISSIWIRRDDPDVIYISSPYNWHNPTEDQKKIQLKLLPKYRNWKASFDVLFNHITPDLEKQVKEIDTYLNAYIIQYTGNRQRDYAPSSIPYAKKDVQQYVEQLIDIMNLYKSSSEKFIVIPDSNALLVMTDWTDYQALIEQDKIQIVLTPTVLSELDELKINHRNPDTRDKAKTLIRRIKGLRNQGSLNDGVITNKSITIRAISKEPKFEHAFDWLDPSNADDRIIASSLEIQRDYPSEFVVIITADINLQNKAELAYLNYADPDPDN